MKKICLFIVITILLLTSCNYLSAEVINIPNESINKITYWFGGGMPPRVENASTDPYYFKKTFSSDGKVECRTHSYDETLLESEDWQVSPDNFQILVSELKQAGFFTLPTVFVYGAFDGGGGTLSAYTKDSSYSSGYQAGHTEEDLESYKIWSLCIDAFSKWTKKMS